MLDLEPRQLERVRAILQHHAPAWRVWAFGSRVTGHARRFSDLDLAVEANGPLSFREMGALREAFEESDLPILVDVVDLHAVEPGFRQLVERERLLIQPGQPD